MNLSGMDIRRQYTMPNCILVLQGMSNGGASGESILSIVVNVECQFIGIEQKLSGGREFLDNLIYTVSAYAQEFLSGVRQPREENQKSDRIVIEPLAGSNWHRLRWYSSETADAKPVNIELTTVQLFDLVDAIDTLIADKHTLPDLSVRLQPLSRRYRQPDRPAAERIVPATAGVMGLAATALIFFLIPAGEISKPKDPVRKVNPTPTSTIPGAQPAPTAPPTGNQTPSSPSRSAPANP
jgi:hypothetical protein